MKQIREESGQLLLPNEIGDRGAGTMLPFTPNEHGTPPAIFTNNADLTTKDIESNHSNRSTWAV